MNATPSTTPNNTHAVEILFRGRWATFARCSSEAAATNLAKDVRRAERATVRVVRVP